MSYNSLWTVDIATGNIIKNKDLFSDSWKESNFGENGDIVIKQLSSKYILGSFSPKYDVMKETSKRYNFPKRIYFISNYSGDILWEKTIPEKYLSKEEYDERMVDQVFISEKNNIFVVLDSETKTLMKYRFEEEE
ncbi:MAG: hypothetical protein AB1546_14940 [bacterium]